MTPLHYIGEYLRELLMSVPLSAVRILFLLVFVALIIWVLTLPRSETTDPSRKYRLAENLKLWGVLALLIQVVIYSVL
ncbi:MAG: hypothetical protein JSV03_07130 [Planctomycetota bacterium]|nr:MAG: hypothetical protein JSV03_07130 [Planctomycetota bacterium]